LFDDTDATADEATVGPAAAAPRLDDFAFRMDRVPGDHRALDVELHVQSKAGMLHRRLDQEALGESIDECRRREPPFDVRFMREKFEIGEQHLDHAGAVHKIGDVGLGDRAPDCLELPPDRQILKAEAEPHGLHAALPNRPREHSGMLRAGRNRDSFLRLNWPRRS
jgi:hypothetical protein